MNLNETLIGDNTSKRVQIAKVGYYTHNIYGPFSISEYDLERMVHHLSINARRQTIEDRPVVPFDYKHDDEDVAAGWITKLEIDVDKNGVKSLFAEVEWTPVAADKIRKKEFKFVSPSIRRNYRDAETGEKFDVLLIGAALTNVPFLRDMEAIYLLSEQAREAFLKNQNMGEEKMSTDEIMTALAAMTPDEKSHVFESLANEMESAVMGENALLSEKVAKAADELKDSKEKLALSKKTISDLKVKISGSDDMADKLKLSEIATAELNEKVASLVKKLAQNDKKASFDQLLTAGNAVEAQREAFMSDNMVEFASKSQVVKLSETGHGKDPDNTGDAQAEIDKLACEKVESSKDGIDYGDAVSMVLSENPKLRDKAGY